MCTGGGGGALPSNLTVMQAGAVAKHDLNFKTFQGLQIEHLSKVEGLGWFMSR